jgi:signal transduction histidine kinase
MFERFFRTSAARGQAIPGSGLGLSITKGLVEAHGGTLTFQSEQGVGTTFRVELPVEGGS